MHASADARALLRLRARFKESREELGLRGVSINDLVHLATVRTLLEFPEVNALLEGDAIRRYGSVNLAFAVDTPRGLMVPVIPAAERLSLRELAEAARTLFEACRDGSVNPDSLQGGTFTVSNIGALGIERFTPILNPPQVGILGVGAINLAPVREAGELVFVERIGLSLTIDHRAVDGGPGARFLQALAAAIADIDMLLAV
jgi:pyruvate dehydrogenase E2 component (dihydrolipoamide acetyltransferase)